MFLFCLVFFGDAFQWDFPENLPHFPLIRIFGRSEPFSGVHGVGYYLYLARLFAPFSAEMIVKMCENDYNRTSRKLSFADCDARSDTE